VHDAEAVQNHVRLRRDCGEPTLSKQWDPGATMRAAELDDGVPTQPTRAPTWSIAATAWSFSASGSTPRGSSVTVSSSAS
jgi:hypothetical protein